MAKKATKVAKTRSKPAPAKKAGKSAGASAFAAALSGLAGRWKTERSKQDAGFSDEIPEIDDGTYHLAVTSARCGVSEKTVGEGRSKKAVKIPWVRFSFVVVDGDFEGTTLSNFDNLVNIYVDPAEDRKLEFFAKVIHGLGYDAEEVNSPAEIEALMATINKDKPHCQAAVKNRLDNTGTPRLSIFINKPLDNDGNVLTNDE